MSALGEDRDTVAIVDDDEAVRESLRFLLETEGLPVVTFPSAVAFLAEARQDRLACLVIDHQMPVLTGLDLLGRLRDEGSTLPAVLVTALPSHLVAERAATLGVHAVLRKPMTDDALIAAVAGAMALPRRG